MSQFLQSGGIIQDNFEVDGGRTYVLKLKPDRAALPEEYARFGGFWCEMQFKRS